MISALIYTTNIRYLDSNRIPRAIVTRNVSASIDYFHNVAWSEQPFRPALSREFRPYKPNPAAILHICEEVRAS